MVTPELITFIQAQRASFAPVETIRNILRSSGWSEIDIEAGLAEADRTPVVPPPLTSPTVTPNTAANSGRGLLRIILITILVCVTAVFLFAIISVLVVFYKAGKSVHDFELLQTQVAIELSGGNNHDIYPATLAGIAKNPDVYDYTVSADQKNYRLCFKGKTDRENCVESPVVAPPTSIANLCTDVDDATTKEEMRNIFELQKQLEQHSQQKFATSTTDPYGLNSLNASLATQKKYTDQIVIASHRQVASSSPSQVSRIYEEYCSSTTTNLPPSILASTSINALETELSESSFGTLSCKLNAHAYDDSKASYALNNYGLKLIQAGHFDDGFKIYQCAAEKYYNPTAMYRVAQALTIGSDNFKNAVPDTVITNEIKPDRKRAYFWIVALFKMLAVQKSDILGTDRGTNMIGLLDTLQQDKTLSDQELLSTEDEATAFVAQRYPQVLEDKTSLYAHSMRSMLATLTQAATAPTSTPQEYYDDTSVSGIRFIVPAGWVGHMYREDSSSVVELVPASGDSHVNIRIMSTFSYRQDAAAFAERYRAARLALRTTKTADEKKIAIGGKTAVGIRYLYDFPSLGRVRTSEYVVSDGVEGDAHIFDINGEINSVQKYEKEYLTLLKSVQFIPTKRRDYSPKSEQTFKTFGGGIYRGTVNDSNFQMIFPFGWTPIVIPKFDDGTRSTSSLEKYTYVAAEAPVAPDDYTSHLVLNVDIYPLAPDVTIAKLLEEKRTEYKTKYSEENKNNPTDVIQGDIVEKAITLGGEAGYELEFIHGYAPIHTAVYFVIHNGRHYAVTFEDGEQTWANQSQTRELLVQRFSFTD